MDLFCVSLTGADDAVPVSELARLSKKFPLIEWAILSSAKNTGRSRFPSEGWVESFHQACPHVRKAIHLCGNDVGLFLDADPRILKKVSRFDRVQLNFNHRRQPIDLDKLIAASKRISQTIILQHNSANEGLWGELHGKIASLSFLFDSSGGRGLGPNQWPTMLPETVCGFAGGLSPTTIRTELPRIREASLGKRCWADMESGIRVPVTDAFSVQACEMVMEGVNDFLKAI